MKVPAAALTVRSSNVPRAEGTFSRQSISSGQLRASQNVFNTNRPQRRTLSSALFYTESSNTAAPTRTKEHVSGTRWVQMLLERDLGKPDLIPGRSDKLKNEFSKGRAEILRYFHLILTWKSGQTKKVCSQGWKGNRIRDAVQEVEKYFFFIHWERSCLGIYLKFRAERTPHGPF